MKSPVIPRLTYLPYALVHLRKSHTAPVETKLLLLFCLPKYLNTTSQLVVIVLHVSQLALRSVQSRTYPALILVPINVIQARVHPALLKLSDHVDVVQVHAKFGATRYIRIPGRKLRSSYVTSHVPFFGLVGCISADVSAVLLHR